MSVFRYLRDQFRFVLLFLIMNLLIAMMTLLDAQSRMQTGNALYLAVICFVLFAICLVVDYAIKNRQIKVLHALEANADKTPVLPPPADYKDEVYGRLIQSLFEEYSNSIIELKEVFKENTDFMTAWVHEVKTPITAAKLLTEDSIAENQTADSLREEIERIHSSVEKVLFYARSDSFSKDYLIAEEMLEKLAKESAKKHSTLFYRKRIRLETKLFDGLTVFTDKKWLIFIMDQLLSNALKYTPDGGCITISARQDEKENILEISDTGSGIKSEDIQRVFAHSFTGHNGREADSHSTGLGLYLSQKLAHKLGHYLTIDSVYGSGTTVQIHFPILNDYFNVTQM